VLFAPWGLGRAYEPSSLSSGRRLSSPALVADGNHARIDRFVSLGVVASAIAVALGAKIADPIIGLAITLVIIKITWDSWQTVTTAEPGELVDFTPPTSSERVLDRRAHGL
jgi:divalent metal cation (Fe/Co/Zn/Cd) transporter